MKNLNNLNLESKVETLLNGVKWDEKGLVVAEAQNVDTGAILMQGFVNWVALITTISSQKATFYSRSGWSTLWTKDNLPWQAWWSNLPYWSETCYYTSVTDLLRDKQAEGDKFALTSLYSLKSTISQLKAELAAPQVGKPSWTK